MPIRYIKLTNSKKKFWVDECDYQRVFNYDWYLHNSSSIRTKIGGKTILLGRFILGLTDSKMVCDHINRDIFDNRRCNLREATRKQNVWNSGKRSDGLTSDNIGVYWRKDRSKWVAQVEVDEHTYTLGHFNSEIEAAMARDEFVKKRRGEYAVLNFPKEKEKAC